MRVGFKSKSGVEAFVSMRFIFECPKCGWNNELQRLNPRNSVYVTMEDGETHEAWCHECDYEEPFILSLD